MTPNQIIEVNRPLNQAPNPSNTVTEASGLFTIFSLLVAIVIAAVLVASRFN